MTTFDNATTTPTLADLGHGKAVEELSALTSGVILVSGKHGSGKTTTLVSLAKAFAAENSVLVAEIVKDEVEDKGLPRFVMADRPYKSVSKNPKLEDLQAAQRFVLTETAGILKEGVQVAVFDDIRHAEAALMASHLASAGVVVLASIHNSGDAKEAVKRFVELPGKLSTVTLDASLVKAVVHQDIHHNDGKFAMSSKVL